MSNVCVFGAGAIGGHLAARLAHAGHRVHVVARGAHLAAMRERGLRLLLPQQEILAKVEATADPREIGAVDVVLVTLKANAIVSTAPALVDLAKRTRAIAFVTNGIPWWYGMGRVPALSSTASECIDPAGLTQAIPADRVVGAVAYSPNTVVAPGVVRCAATTSRFEIGPATAAGGAATQAVHELLEGAGITAPVDADIRTRVWRKLAFNVAISPVSTLTGGGNQQVTADPVLHRLCADLMRETAAAAAAQGERVTLDESVLDPGKLSPHKPSMLQDLEAGRPLETESILRAVQVLARDAGVATPQLDVVTALVEMRARTRS
ncbi:MAG: 2-dehydropantoate 2-reductase [Burkholderiales bacterium]|nr:2-dehydropantoate 2-reductase [Burkholderiales bacterium]